MDVVENNLSLSDEDPFSSSDEDTFSSSDEDASSLADKNISSLSDKDRATLWAKFNVKTGKMSIATLEEVARYRKKEKRREKRDKKAAMRVKQILKVTRKEGATSVSPFDDQFPEVTTLQQIKAMDKEELFLRLRKVNSNPPPETDVDSLRYLYAVALRIPLR